MGTPTERALTAAAVLWALALALGGCPRSPYHCPPAYTPVCQSGSMYGTRCMCEPPRRYSDPR